LGTTATVLVTDDGSLPAAWSAVEAELVAMDAACSRFRDDSDLARVNRAGGAPVVVGGLFLEALGAALRAARLTDGAVDPTVGRALQRAGYDRDFSALPATVSPRRLAIRPIPGWRRVVVDATAATVRVPDGVALDLGATAKALAADLAARAASHAQSGGVLVSLGGDIGMSGAAPSEGWRIGVGDDHRAALSSVSQTLSLVSGGLATSSTTVRRWRVGNETAHHLIDPSTGCPASSCWRTVSVAAGSCVDANTASTAAIIRGADAATWLDELGLPARLVRMDGTVVRVGGWPGEAEA
jgi:thiamine biosynthesis lipoprotein